MKVQLRKRNFNAGVREPLGDFCMQLRDRTQAAFAIGKVGTHFKAPQAITELIQHCQRRGIVKNQ